MRYKVTFLGICLALSCCTNVPTESAAQRADDAACTKQADAIYAAQSQDQLGRTTEAGLHFSGTPNEVFDAERLGALHERNSQLAACEQYGNSVATAARLPGIVTPHIIVTQ